MADDGRVARRCANRRISSPAGEKTHPRCPKVVIASRNAAIEVSQTRARRAAMAESSIPELRRGRSRVAITPLRVCLLAPLQCRTLRRAGLRTALVHEVIFGACDHRI